MYNKVMFGIVSILQLIFWLLCIMIYFIKGYSNILIAVVVIPISWLLMLFYYKKTNKNHHTKES